MVMSSNETELTLPDGAWFRRLRRKVSAWFSGHARDLPWRKTTDPYAIWVSEVMLQQTQVATVIPYHARFLAAFPSIAALAAADEEAVLRLWEGLGYYRRARQLHQAAKKIVADHSGEFPRDYDAVRQLPGIGRYTAGAILSIAFDQSLPILEANTSRLFARLLAFRGDITSPGGTRLLWSFAEAIVPRRGAGRLNQAVMELGSLICVPKSPRCDVCPAAALCRARIENAQNEIPRSKAKPVFIACREAVVLVRRRGEVLLCRQQEGERWAGLWDFPRFPAEGPDSPTMRENLSEAVRARTGVAISIDSHAGTLRHGVTRYRITLDSYHARPSGGRIRDPENTRWVALAELDRYPLSATGRKLAGRLVDQ